MPKRIALTGRAVPLQGAVIAIGAKASEQDRIGADWINSHVASRGAQQLPVVLETGVPEGVALVIRVGTRASAEGIDDAAAGGAFQLEAGVPGSRGYVVNWRRTEGHDEVILAGEDPFGALYACVTLSELLQGQGEDLSIRQAEIVDWPDFPGCTDCVSLYNPESHAAVQALAWGKSPSEESIEQYVAARKRDIDRLLRWKYSVMNAREATIRWRMADPEHQPSRRGIRQVTDYARARGIRVLAYAYQPFVGKRKDFPAAPERCATLHNGTRWEGTIRCWSMDAERRETAARLADYLVDCGVTDVGFHDTDTGGFDNPAQWEHRCDVCRGRWGDDYAAATVNKFGIYREEIKKRMPDARLHFTFYPYNISAMTLNGSKDYLVDRYGPDPGVTARAEALTDNFTIFWKGISAGMPLDVTFCIRENVFENVRTFFDTTAPHGVFTWYKAGAEQWMPFFDETPRFVPTFWSGHDDMLYTVSMNTFLPIKALAVREYAWNVNAPGAGHWHRLATSQQHHHADPKGAIYEVVLPHVVRNVFGRRAAPEIVEALSCNVAPNQIFDVGDRMTPVLDTSEMMSWQVQEAARGARALDRLNRHLAASGDRLGMTMYAQRRFVYLREVMHCCLWMAQVKLQNLQARELATQGKLKAARAAIAEGRRLIEAAREAMITLVAQRPPDPLYNAPPAGNDYNRRWRLYTPVWGVDFDAQESVLAQTEKELESLTAAGQLSEGMLDQLRRRTGLHVFQAQTPPVLQTSETVFSDAKSSDQRERIGANRAAARIRQWPCHPVMDGDLGDAVWSKAVAGEAFWRYPGFESIGRAHTQSRFLRHGQTLYLSMTCWMPGRAEVTAVCTERDGDDIFSDEHVELFLWPKAGGSTYYQLAFNPRGAVADVRHISLESPGGGTVTQRDDAWTVKGLVARPHIGDGVWTLEAAIPLASCKPDSWNGDWHANVARRFVEPTGEHEWSALMKPGAHGFHDTTKFLPLLFSDVPSPPPLIEIAVAGLHTRPQTLDDRVATLVDFGLDVHSSRILHNVRLIAETLDEQGKTHFKQPIKPLDHLVYRWTAEQDFTIGFDREVSKGALKITLISDEITVETLADFGGWEGVGTTASLFTPPVPNRETSEIIATPSLAGPVYLPGTIATEDGRDERMLDRHRGTLEFWTRPHWGECHPCETRLPWMPVRTFVHAGILRRSHPSLLNLSCFAMQSDARGNTLRAIARNKDYAGWTHDARSAKTVGWIGSEWRHVAFVWDANAASDDQFRLYVNGRRAGHRVVKEKPERMGDDVSVRLPEQAFALQLLALNSGRGRAEADMDELRISRTVRYTGEFEPSRKPFEADRNTVALFHFDGNLKGIGMTADGVVYEIEAVPGVLELN